MGIMDEFREFLREYKITSLAIAFIIGAAATALVQSLVNNLIMPLIAPLTSNGDWQSATLLIGSVKIAWGAFLSSLINFTIIALVVFLAAKFILREEKAAKK